MADHAAKEGGSSTSIIVLRDREGKAIIYNKAFNAICNELFHIEAYPGIRTMDYLPADRKEHWEQTIMRVLSGETVREQFTYTFDDGSVRTYDLAFNPIFQKDTVVGFSEFNRDITEQKNSENELRQALKEKDFLLGEINHRVKNNLSIISSLIHLKDSALGNSVDLSDITNQINAISLVHEKLYKSESITHIEFKEYIQDLLTTVFYSFTKKRVAIENEIGDVSLPTKTAVTLGLIVNEIATNAIKYGFTSDVEPEFTVSLKEDASNNQYILTLSNTGNPFRFLQSGFKSNPV